MPHSDFEKIYTLVLNRLKELAPALSYHCIEHTLDVLQQASRVAKDENINEKELYLLRVAALYHDTGFLYKYKDHESKSCEIFLEDSKQFTFTDSDKRIIVDLIMATRVPQQPKTLLQRIICDADLDYLGRHDFDVIAAKLKSEFFNFGIVSDEKDWHTLQKMFLENHSYHTSSSQLLREPVKKENLSKIKKKDS
ncbi:MAG: HD domain-containing protein [Bacteroidetes bacterium]|nr:HD domain-containing protein [Bacteroidota bacterium]